MQQMKKIGSGIWIYRGFTICRHENGKKIWYEISSMDASSPERYRTKKTARRDILFFVQHGRWLNVW